MNNEEFELFLLGMKRILNSDNPQKLSRKLQQGQEEEFKGVIDFTKNITKKLNNTLEIFQQTKDIKSVNNIL
jgi:hypothetical protein